MTRTFCILLINIRRIRIKNNGFITIATQKNLKCSQNNKNEIYLKRFYCLKTHWKQKNITSLFSPYKNWLSLSFLNKPNTFYISHRTLTYVRLNISFVDLCTYTIAICFILPNNFALCLTNKKPLIAIWNINKIIFNTFTLYVIKKIRIWNKFIQTSYYKFKRVLKFF